MKDKEKPFGCYIPRRIKGFALADVIIAITVLMLVSAPLLGSMLYGLRVERRAQIHALAAYAAQMEMEMLYGSFANADELKKLLEAINYNENDWLDYDFEPKEPVEYSIPGLYEVTIIMENIDFDIKVELTALLPASMAY